MATPSAAAGSTPFAAASATVLLAAGDPAGALQALQQQVRANAADAKLRVFLFQLLCVLGQWPRALDQLKVCGELDAGTLAMVNTYRAAIHCDLLELCLLLGSQQILDPDQQRDGDPLISSATRSPLDHTSCPWTLE